MHYRLTTTQKFYGDLFRQEDADLAEIFFLNVITKRVYTEYCENSGAKPTQIMIRVSCNKLSSLPKPSWSFTIMYWLNKQQEKN